MINCLPFWAHVNMPSYPQEFVTPSSNTNLSDEVRIVITRPSGTSIEITGPTAEDVKKILETIEEDGGDNE